MVYREVTMIEIKEILLRVASGYKVRAISKSLGIHRKTITGYISLANELGAKLDLKDSITDELVEKIKARMSEDKNKKVLSPREEILLPHKEKIEEYLKQGLKGSKIIRLLAREGIRVSRQSFYRFINTSCPSYMKKNITVRLPETEPGQYAQADFGYMGKIWDPTTSKLRKIYALIITLIYSRLMYVYMTFKCDIRAVIEGFEEAWAYFGGITELVIVDNCKPAVKEPGKYNPVINKYFLEYSQHRGFIVDPADIGHATGKPHVERMVPYVRDNFFTGENFLSRDDCAQRAVDWCSNVAGARIHGTTKRIPMEVFKEIEEARLIPYPGDRYDIPWWANCKVHPDHHVKFKNALYSIPTRYIGKSVDVRGDSALVKVYYKGSVIKIHKPVGEGKRSTDFNDYPAELTPYTLRNPNYQIAEGYRIDPAIGSYIEQILTGPYPWHRLRSAQKILRLADKYGAGRMAAALTKAKAYSIYDMRRIENMLKNGVESDMPMLEETAVQLKIEELKFLRDSSSFNHYKDN